MALRLPLRAALNRIRAIPGALGLRTYSVAVEVTTWSGAELGEGVGTVVLTPVVERNGQPPKVRWLSNREIALGGYEDGTVEVGPITPDFPGGGIALATLHPNPPVNTTVRWILYGPQYGAAGGRFRVRNVTHEKALHYSVTLERAAD